MADSRRKLRPVYAYIYITMLPSDVVRDTVHALFRGYNKRTGTPGPLHFEQKQWVTL